MRTLLIVEDNAEICKQLKWGLSKDYTLLFAKNRQDGIKLVSTHNPPVVTLDLGLPPDEEGVTEGFACLEEILKVAPRTKVIVVTGRDDIQNAIQSVSAGAYDYYPKPIDLKVFKVILERAFYLSELEEENISLQSFSGDRGIVGMFGLCPEMQDVFSVVRKVAQVNIPILVLGDSGTGKEMIAQAIHALSPRKEGPFVPINCGAIPENLLESELFGHEKGAFTGAHALSRGKVEQANGGTLFLDEIAEMSPGLQVKLLRFLQDKIIQRVGGRVDISVDTRIIAATNVEISGAMSAGLFREDLYYRLSVVCIHLPQLKDRGEDILLLANYFLSKYAREFNRKVRTYSVSAVQEIESYDWPGNVREMENRVKRAVVMADGAVVTPKALGFTISGEPCQETTNDACHFVTEYNLDDLTLKEARDMIERDMVLSTLERADGNISRAASRLGITRSTMYDLIKKHNLMGAGQATSP